MHILVERASKRSAAWQQQQSAPIVDNLKYGLATRCLHYGRAAGSSGARGATERLTCEYNAAG